MVFLNRWSLWTGGICVRVVFMNIWYLCKGGGLCEQVVFVNRWSLWTERLRVRVVFVNRWSLHKGGLYEQMVFVLGWYLCKVVFVNRWYLCMVVFVKCVLYKSGLSVFFVTRWSWWNRLNLFREHIGQWSGLSYKLVFSRSWLKF